MKKFLILFVALCTLGGSNVAMATTFTAQKGCAITVTKQGNDAVVEQQNVGDTVIHFRQSNADGRGWIVTAQGGVLKNAYDPESPEGDRFQVKKEDKWLLITPEAGAVNCALKGVAQECTNPKGCALEGTQ